MGLSIEVSQSRIWISNRLVDTVFDDYFCLSLCTSAKEGYAVHEIRPSLERLLDACSSRIKLHANKYSQKFVQLTRVHRNYSDVTAFINLLSDILNFDHKLHPIFGKNLAQLFYLLRRSHDIGSAQLTRSGPKVILIAIVK